MSPLPLYPINNTAQSMHPLSTDLVSESTRKRVCKACDRCRLKKSRCDGSQPCLRCKADNAICVFGERKKSQDKVYPKGYVEMLERQQGQLVAALQQSYVRLRDARAWPGPPLVEHNGRPLTHDVLAAFDLLELQHDGGDDSGPFIEDVEDMQAHLVARGAPYVPRRSSCSSESKSPCDHDEPYPHSVSSASTRSSKPSHLRESFDFSDTSTPSLQSLPSQQQESYSPTQSARERQQSMSSNDPRLYQANWPPPSYTIPDQSPRSKGVSQTPYIQPDLLDMDNFLEDGLDLQSINSFLQSDEAPYQSGQTGGSYDNTFPGFVDYGMADITFDNLEYLKSAK